MMKRVLVLLLGLLCLASISHATVVNLAWDYDPAQVPTGLTFTGFTLSWKLGTGAYAKLADVPLAARLYTHTFDNPALAAPCYHVVATAKNTAGASIESAPSNEACATLPLTPGMPVNLHVTGNILSGSQLAVVAVDSEEIESSESGAGKNAIDGNPNTFWHSRWLNQHPALPHFIVLDLGLPYLTVGWTYLPRQDTGQVNGYIGKYQVFISDSPTTFPTTPVLSGEFTSSKVLKTAPWTGTVGRYVKILVTSEANGSLLYTSAAEIGILIAK